MRDLYKSERLKRAQCLAHRTGTDRKRFGELHHTREAIFWQLIAPLDALLEICHEHLKDRVPIGSLRSHSYRGHQIGKWIMRSVHRHPRLLLVDRKSVV